MPTQRQDHFTAAMLTRILIVGVEATTQGHYRLRYLPIPTKPLAAVQPELSSIPPSETARQPTSKARGKPKPRIATAGLALCQKYLICPGICFSVRLNLSDASCPTVTWLEAIQLPNHHYSLALPSIVEHLPYPIDHQALEKALFNIGKYPALLARLLNSATPAMLENYVDQYSALKLHQAWQTRKALEAAVLHLSSLNLPTRLAPNLCKVQLPLTGSITTQRLALDIQTRTCATQDCFFYTETKILLYLTHARSQGISLVDRTHLVAALQSTADCIDHALGRLETNTSIKVVNSNVILSNEYYLELSLNSALTLIESYAPLPVFYEYEIGDCVERASLLRRERPNSIASAAIYQCFNNRVSTVYISPITMRENLLPILSSVSQQLLNSRPLIITPAANSLKHELEAYGTVIALTNFSHYNLGSDDAIIIALDADSYSKHEFLTLLRGVAPGHRLLIQGTSYSGHLRFGSKVQHQISNAYPLISLSDTTFASSGSSEINHLTTTSQTRSHVYFDVSLHYLFRLILKTDAVAFVPSQRQANKLNNMLHKWRQPTSSLSVRTTGSEFYIGDRVMFLRPSPPLDFEKYPIGVILSIQETTILLKFNDTYLPITATAFINSKPSPCYFISIEHFTRTTIAKCILVVPKARQFTSDYIQLACQHSSKSIGVAYGIDNLTITLPQALSITHQTMMNIIPHLV